MKAIVIDDEARARRILVALLAEHCPQVEVVAEASDVPEAVQAINAHQPEVVFLDIEMPGYSGFQLLDFFKKPDFSIVFTTAYSDYAVQAFEVSAVDYLLKPIQIDGLVRAVERVGQLQEASVQPLEVLQHNLRDEGVVRKLAVPVSDGLLFVNTSELVYLQADGSYTNFFLENGSRLLVSKKLGEFEVLLRNPRFFRPHRSFIINLDRVQKYVRQEGGYILMETDAMVSLSRDKKDEFLSLVQAR